METIDKKIASSSSIENLTNLINQYFYSTTYEINIENNLYVIYNKFGLYLNGYVIKRDSKFIFYQYK